jgi:hypothetical protein
MAKAKRSRFRTTVYAFFALAVCVVPPFLLGGNGCQLDTRPIIKPHPPVDDEDAG